MKKLVSVDIMDRMFIEYFGKNYNKNLTTIEVNEKVSDGEVFCDYVQMDGVEILAHQMRLKFGNLFDSNLYMFGVESVCEAIREAKEWYKEHVDDKVDSIDIRGNDLPCIFNLEVKNDNCVMVLDEAKASEYFERLKENNAIRNNSGYLTALQMLIVIDYTRYESAMQNQAAKLVLQGYTKEGLEMLAKYIDSVD